MNDTEIREAIRRSPQRIQVCCPPHGHFIVTVKLYVYGDGPIKVMPQFPANVHRKRRRTPGGLLPGATA